MFREQVLQHYREKGYALRERVKVRGSSGAVHACDLVAQGPLGNLVVQFEDYGGFEGPELDAVRRIARDVGATPVVAAQEVSATVRRHAGRLGVVVVDAQSLATPVVSEVQGTVDREPAYPAWPDPDAPRKRKEAEVGAATGAATEGSWPADGRSRPAASPRMDPGDVDDLVSEWTRPQPPRPTRREDPGFWKYDRDGEMEAPGPSVAPSVPPATVPSGSARPTGSATGFSWLGATGSDPPGAPEAVHAAPRTVPAERRPKVGAPPATAAATTTASSEPRDLRWLVGYAVAGATAGAAFLGIGALLGLF